MSIFGDIWNKITGSAEAAPATATAGGTPAEPTTTTASATPMSEIDVERILSGWPPRRAAAVIGAHLSSIC